MAFEKKSSCEISQTAMDLLARREHSFCELQQKLRRRFGDSDLIAPVLEHLVTADLQSDERFAEAFLSARIRKGQGPVRIAMELKVRGLDKGLISTYVDPQDQQWVSLAKKVWQKRFGCCPEKTPTPADTGGVGGVLETSAFEINTEDRKKYAKQKRFLAYRGFTDDQIKLAVGQ